MECFIGILLQINGVDTTGKYSRQGDLRIILGFLCLTSLCIKTNLVESSARSQTVTKIC